MSRDSITWSLDRQAGMYTKIGGYHSFISRDLIMLIKVIKATASKLVLMKATHSYRPRDAITWSLDRQVGMHTKIGGYHSFISRNLIMLIKVIKATAPKLVLTKATHSYKTSLITWYPDKWRASNHNFYKSFKALNLKDNNNTIKCIYSLV